MGQNPRFQANPQLAYRTAVTQLANEGVIENPDQINAKRVATSKLWETGVGLAGDRRVAMVPDPANPRGPAQPHIKVELLKPSTDPPVGSMAPSGAPATTAAPGPTPVDPVTGNPTAPPATPIQQQAPTSQGSIQTAQPVPTPQPTTMGNTVIPPQPRPQAGRGMTTPPQPTAPAPAAPTPTITVPGAPTGRGNTPMTVPRPAPVLSGRGMTTPGQTSLRPQTTATAPATLQTGPPPGALMPAPGFPDGKYVTTADGRPGITRGGWVYPRQ
jgi:hypothetical protein